MRCQKLRLADTFVGALAYADDLVLTAPMHAVRKMFAMCEAYASEHFMNFNAQKSMCMIALNYS